MTLEGPIAATGEPALYQTVRSFPLREPAGYTIPVPPGRYRVTLHFAEVWHRESGRRRFDVRLEGVVGLKDYQPFAAGFATADQRTLEATVTDGFLDIDFIRKVDDPLVSAIEVRRD